MVDLADLISMKLGSGNMYVHRAQDPADVVRLIQRAAHGLPYGLR